MSCVCMLHTSVPFIAFLLCPHCLIVLFLYSALLLCSRCEPTRTVVTTSLTIEAISKVVELVVFDLLPNPFAPLNNVDIA